MIETRTSHGFGLNWLEYHPDDAHIGFVCPCGVEQRAAISEQQSGEFKCAGCGRTFRLAITITEAVS